MHAAGEKRDPDFVFKVADLSAERRLRRVKPRLRRELHASGLGDREKVAKVPQLQNDLYISQA